MWLIVAHFIERIAILAAMPTELIVMGQSIATMEIKIG